MQQAVAKQLGEEHDAALLIYKGVLKDKPEEKLVAVCANNIVALHQVCLLCLYARACVYLCLCRCVVLFFVSVSSNRFPLP